MVSLFMTHWHMIKTFPTKYFYLQQRLQLQVLMLAEHICLKCWQSWDCILPINSYSITWLIQVFVIMWLQALHKTLYSGSCFRKVNANRLKLIIRHSLQVCKKQWCYVSDHLGWFYAACSLVHVSIFYLNSLMSLLFSMFWTTLGCVALLKTGSLVFIPIVHLWCHVVILLNKQRNHYESICVNATPLNIKDLQQTFQVKVCM